MKLSERSGVCYSWGLIADCRGDLSPAQLADVELLKLDKRRLERTALYSIVNKYVGNGLVLGHDPDGAPRLPGVENFSLSHSSHYAAAAWSAITCVGIDIEESTPRLPRLAAKFMADRELALLSPLTPLPHLLAWTVKEAAFKAAGQPGAVLRDINITEASEAADGAIEGAASLGGHQLSFFAREIDGGVMLSLAYRL